MMLLVKSHVKGYTKKDGTVVKPHEDKRHAQGNLFGHASSGKSGKPFHVEHQKVVAPQFGFGLMGGSLFSFTPKEPKAYHPKPNDKGAKVGIYDPSTPTGPETWENPQAVATWTPGSPVPAELNGIPFAPWTDHPVGEDWDYVDGQIEDMDEPPMHLTQGKHPATGVFIEEPDGRVWLVSPTNGFGGYSNTYPKGTAEDELSWQANAIKECYEESGLKVEITGLVGDFDGTTSVTRYYTAKRVGGSPADVGWESQSVHLVPRAAFKKMLSSNRDLDIAELT